MNSTFEARFQLKRDTQEAWERNNPVLLNGEPILVDFPDGTHKMKTGDGSSRYRDLPFDGTVTYSTPVEAVLLSSAWSGKEQRIPIPGLKANGNGMASLRADASAQQAEAAADGRLRISRQEDGFLTIAADGTVPSVDLPILVILLATADASSVLQVSLTASGWSGGRQRVAVPGITANTNGSASVGSGATPEQMEAARKAQLRVLSQETGAMTFQATGTVPGIDIPISVLTLGEEV